MNLFHFIETPEFTKKIAALLTDDEFSGLQIFLCENPDFGKLIEGSGGVRKIRWAVRGRGKSGGVRVLYYLVTDKDKILLLDIYSKSDRETVTDNEIRSLRKIAERFRNE